MCPPTLLICTPAVSLLLDRAPKLRGEGLQSNQRAEGQDKNPIPSNTSAFMLRAITGEDFLSSPQSSLSGRTCLPAHLVLYRVIRNGDESNQFVNGPILFARPSAESAAAINSAAIASKTKQCANVTTAGSLRSWLLLHLAGVALLAFVVAPRSLLQASLGK